MSTVRDTQDKDYTVPPTGRRVHRTKLQDTGPVPEGSVPGDPQHDDNIGTNPRNEVAVPVVRSSTYHQSTGQGMGRCVPETGQAAHCGACVIRPRLNWEGWAVWNHQNWYHAGSSELGP